jgi:hypothetical protein
VYYVPRALSTVWQIIIKALGPLSKHQQQQTGNTPVYYYCPARWLPGYYLKF